MKKTVSAVSAVSLLLAATAVRADHPLEELEVIGTGHAGQLAIDAGRAASPDSGKLLDKLPGANANNNGPLTSIAQFRGMYGDRVAVLIDGMPMTGGG
ncbi:MAG TPA: TonB-dependent receptor plug domain-containing protein, partial [Pseudomonadales bacterium]